MRGEGVHPGAKGGAGAVCGTAAPLGTAHAQRGRDGDEAASALGAQKHPLVISNHGLARIPGPPKVPGVPRAARGVWRVAKEGELALGHFALSLLPLSLCGQRDPGFAG